MAAPPLLNWRDVVRVFAKAGWSHDRTRGSHYIMMRPGVGRISVPMHKQVARGTLRSLIHAAGMTLEQFVALL